MVDLSSNVLIVGSDDVRRELRSRLRRIGFSDRRIHFAPSTDQAISALTLSELSVGFVICEVLIRNRDGIRGDVLLRFMRGQIEPNLAALPFVLVFAQDTEGLSFEEREVRSRASQTAKDCHGVCIESVSRWTYVLEAITRAHALVAA